ncbi:hypothetical protein OIU77_019557 [Salix suchowensis]|uniref:WW domain-containing protein n=1 Tax=Salix suchowensis TaxID=1278906 RepID=A0ABQ9CGF5_9ROSI|nr:hypothetical protein OIU78_022255 [Salix suchowensis]KAJ6398812.1 hypothetical protein OIU77_019557 [Salix suchowensis]
MVSFEALPSPNGRVPIPELDDSSKKRKWEEVQAEGTLEKRSKPESTKSFFEEIELQLESTPLPLEWQRCLDIQSGQIHFYNTRTHKRTSIDPRKSPEPPSPDHHMSLDLELNLPYDQSQRKSHHVTKKNSGGSIRPGMGDHLIGDNSGRDKGSSEGQRRGPSWLESERDQQEMVATVCTKCHMLVMLCRSSPACPNCKFLHPLEQSSPKLFKQRLSLLW